MSDATAANLISSISAIKKDAENQFQKYRYASVDAVFEAVRGAIGAAGLVVWCHEEAFEIHRPDGESKAKPWAFAAYRLALAPVGDPPDWERAERITIPLQLVGPQSAQAARSYAIKYWLRGKLLLPTGDQDLDATAEPDEPAPRRGRKATAPKPAQTITEESPPAPRRESAARVTIDILEGEIALANLGGLSVAERSEMVREAALAALRRVMRSKSLRDDRDRRIEIGRTLDSPQWQTVIREIGVSEDRERVESAVATVREKMQKLAEAESPESAQEEDPEL